MDLIQKVRAVEGVFEKLDLDVSNFQGWSGLHCKAGCGKCCFKSDIEATILEFLPFAVHLHEAGMTELWLEKLKASDSSICLILDPKQSGAGLCSEYRHRGLICRLFGYSARTNKYEKKELVTCQIIKSEQMQEFEDVGKQLENGREVPLMNAYYMQLHGIDIDLTREFYPINTAIRKAIETVLHYYTYR